LGYYVSIGDPDRDVVAIVTRHQQRTGREMPDAFFTGYGRRPDPIAAAAYDGFNRLRRSAEDLSLIVERIATALATAPVDPA
jgi:hypothetical protein